MLNPSSSHFDPKSDDGALFFCRIAKGLSSDVIQFIHDGHLNMVGLITRRLSPMGDDGATAGNSLPFSVER